jgi:uncharacterized protein YPO0396
MNLPMLTTTPVSNLTNAYILQQLTVFNWGPFADVHRAELDPQGTAIIGATGSGKTTLIDALMTLIAAQPKYNLASTGGHESDRDLVSYIRGVTGAGNDSGDNQHIARADKTVSAIHACFTNATQQVHLAALFWIDGTSSAPADVKRLWFFGEACTWQLEQWLSLHHHEGTRAVKALARETTGLQVFDNKKTYLAQVRRFFGVGENAFTLLNRAAGLKQLNSIDEIFRELVLDDHSAFERAGEVASEFDDLADIHSELETARKQLQSLLPIQHANNDYQTSATQLQEQRELLTLLPVWFAQQGHALWLQQEQRLTQTINELSGRMAELAQHIISRRGMATTLKDIYLQAGGASIEQLREQISTQQQLTSELQRNAQDYRRLTQQLQLDDTLSAEALLTNQAQLSQLKDQAEIALQDAKAQRLNIGAELHKCQQQLTELDDEQHKISARSSNIPGNFQDFRTELAQALALGEEQLPFVAELVEVKAEQSLWRGAIERAIGSHRLRILVPPAHMQQALDWVNYRDNRLHVRLEKAQVPATASQFLDDGFTRKLNFKSHEHREALKVLLADIDRHCVDSPQALQHTPHGMTAEGLMSGKSGRFEKQDQQALNKGWMTGFDNKDRLASLARELQETEQARREYQQGYSTAEQAVKGLETQLQLQQQLAELAFEKIDLPSAQQRLTDLGERLARLTDPQSKVEQARRDYERVESELHDLYTQDRDFNNQRGKLQAHCDTAANLRKKSFARIGDGLTAAQQLLAQNQLKLPNNIAPDELESLERNERSRLEKTRDTIDHKVNQLKLKLTRLMGDAKKLDTGALIETGQELQDIPAYLNRLRVLNEEALPEKLNRFLSYLNKSSDQGVTQLLQGIDNEVAMIEERIADLNNTLRRVDFQTDRYLQLEPQRVVHESLRTLQAAHRKLRSAALSDDQGESHYHALQYLVSLLREASDNKKRTQGSRALLDPRYRLQFAVLVCDRASGAIIEKRTGSQGGSGGEKEIIASYILTASLSYALCPDGAAQPLFATIVLDEAFSKSSQAVAGRIVSALREFGLHPLFVTPNKEMRLLRAHTRSAILVHRKGARATLTALTWEELEQHARQKLQEYSTTL